MLEFKCSPRTSLGVEIELQLIDHETRDLVGKAPLVVRLLGKDEKKIKPEIFRSMIEIATDVCDTVSEVRADLGDSLARLNDVCDSLGVRLAGAGTQALGAGAPFHGHRAARGCRRGR